MTSQSTSLAGQVAFVTGGSGGIGFGIAARLAGAGADVALFARSAQALAGAAEAIGNRALAVSGDATRAEDVTSAVAATEEQRGPITLLVHTAGTADVIGPLWEANPDAWWEEVAVHLRGAMLTCRTVLPGMRDRGQGRVVLMYGNLGEGADPWCSAYACGKAGLLRLVGQLGAELADTGVAVFAVHPGLVWTPMTAQLADDGDKRRWLPRFGQWPRQRYGTADAAAQLVTRIARGDADRLSGLLLGVGDDLDELNHEADRIRADQRRTLRTIW